ncbi:endothelin-3b precursor [Danio rerio]|nr:endothelin-3b precursor [Danio rerio]AKS25898.1 endothelin-3 [Danio rerio]AXU25964.1 endothelin 3b [Danio nigrofasciatus]|eukprot:NP_001298142.1 endothelin-3 precursor [Danio rerio]
MAKLIPDALLLIVSLINIFTVDTSFSSEGDLHSSPVFSGGSSSVGHQQKEAKLVSASHAHTRSKRCTCYSFKDRECVYYCHLGIIWINTPQRTVPYGMSSYRSPQRLRRSSGTISVVLRRCLCTDHNDVHCYNFCDASSENVSEGRLRGRSPW